VKYYAKIGRALAEGKMLKEGASIALSKSNAFAGSISDARKRGRGFHQCLQLSRLGLCEKAAPALLSGVPIVVKPASPRHGWRNGWLKIS